MPGRCEAVVLLPSAPTIRKWLFAMDSEWCVRALATCLRATVMLGGVVRAAQAVRSQRKKVALVRHSSLTAR